jgi:hypothetical protein
VSRFIVGLDLGQAADFTALAVLEKRRVSQATEPPPGFLGSWRPPLHTQYDLGHLKRWHLGGAYTAIVAEVVELFEDKRLSGSPLVVDATGVGRAVVDLFRKARPKAAIKPVVITFGQNITPGRGGVRHVPKKDLAGTLQVLFQAKRIKFARLPLVETLVKELQTFKVKITAAGNETFEAWREGDHDDMVLAVALASWWGEWEEKTSYLCRPGFGPALASFNPHSR